MNQSENINEIAAALAKAQAAFQPITRDKTVKVKTKTGGEYTFAYAPLESIMSAVRTALSENGLFISQCVTRIEGTDLVETKIIHQSGQWIANLIPVLVQADGPQAYGSAVTYARRYGVTTLLCLVADEDDDGNVAEGNHATHIQRQPRAGAKQTRDANDYGRRIVEQVTKDNLAAVREIVNEARSGDQEFWAAVWATLPGNVKHYIRDNLKDAA